MSNKQYFCRLGNCWCDNLESNPKQDPNARCMNVLKMNKLDDDGHTSTGWFFIGLHTACPFVDKAHTRIKPEFAKQGYYITHHNLDEYYNLNK